MVVGQKMTKKPVTVAPDASLAAARKKMGGKFRRVPVVENGTIVGIVTDRDLREHKGMLDKTKVNAVMTKKVVTVTSATPIERAARLLLRRKIGGLPVVDDGKLVGIITTSDLLKALVGLVGGAEEGATRIDLVLTSDAETNPMLAATQIVDEEAAEVLGLGTYQPEDEESPIFYVRVPADEAQRVAGALAEKGFDVLAVHE
jgi:acetoin utilization protein AcuB